MQIYRKYLVNCIFIHIFAKENVYLYINGRRTTGNQHKNFYI
nr:MAG TPA: hypothetical protein [Caudoviricetes sp.]